MADYNKNSNKLGINATNLMIGNLRVFANIIIDIIGDNYNDLNPTTYMKALIDIYDKICAVIDLLNVNIY